MEFRTPLGKARGLGSAHAGTLHWWAQRLTALALIPLTLWLVWFLMRLQTLGHAEMVAWLANPWQGSLLLAYVVAAGYHARLGLQVVVEDYVHRPAAHVTALIGIRLGWVLMVLLAGVALMKIIASI